MLHSLTGQRRIVWEREFTAESQDFFGRPSADGGVQRVPRIVVDLQRLRTRSISLALIAASHSGRIPPQSQSVCSRDRENHW